MDENRLGSILLEGGVVDEAGLERCLAIQTLTGSSRPIGRILVEQGLLDEVTLARLLELQRSRTDARAAEVVPDGLASMSLVSAAVANGASEVVVSEGRPARIRVGACWQQLTDEVLSGPHVWDFVRETMGSDVLEQLAENHYVSRSWSIDDVGAGGATAFRQFDGVAVRLTFAPKETATPLELGVPNAVIDATEGGKGLVLCVGERGIGRGELLASLTQHASQDEGQYVVVVDDEPMRLHKTGALVVQRRFGIDPETRANSLRSVVREDPDVMVIADVGSPETFELALRAAEGGRLVIAYLDAKNAVQALARIFSFYPSYELTRLRSALAAVLRTVLVRQLLPNAEHTATVSATELLIVTDAVREVIRGGELEDLGLLQRAEGGSSGYPLDRSMLDLLGSGTVRMEDVFARAEEKSWLLERTRNLAAADPAASSSEEN
ncbi:MAG: Tfp pilus assembly pilus retraction ATPase PilT [Planctomycetota bacterium]|jgi:Tfp pilus assembly pilus retraction ATPase PilT